MDGFGQANGGNAENDVGVEVDDLVAVAPWASQPRVIGLASRTSGEPKKNDASPHDSRGDDRGMRPLSVNTSIRAQWETPARRSSPATWRLAELLSSCGSCRIEQYFPAVILDNTAYRIDKRVTCGVLPGSDERAVDGR